VSGLAPELYNGAEVAGIVGHDAVDVGPDQSTEVAAVVNRPDNEAHARPRWARGVDVCRNREHNPCHTSPEEPCIQHMQHALQSSPTQLRLLVRLDLSSEGVEAVGPS